jgi:CBS domain-containing protein
MAEEQRTASLVRDLVAPASFAVGLDTPLGIVRRLLRQSRCEALPVIEDDKVVGVVTEAELEAMAEASDRARLREVGRMRVVYCFADSNLADAAATMRAAEASHLAVLGEDVRFLGLLAQQDLPPA